MLYLYMNIILKFTELESLIWYNLIPWLSLYTHKRRVIGIPCVWPLLGLKDFFKIAKFSYERINAYMSKRWCSLTGRNGVAVAA